MLHPLEFKEAWGLSWFKMATLFGRQPRSLQRYRPNAPDYREPDETIQIACALQHQLWLINGKQPLKQVEKDLYERVF